MLMPLSLDMPLPPRERGSVSLDELRRIGPLDERLLRFERTPLSFVRHLPLGPNLISSRVPCMGTMPQPRPRVLIAQASPGGLLARKTGSGDRNWTCGAEDEPRASDGAEEASIEEAMDEREGELRAASE